MLQTWIPTHKSPFKVIIIGSGLAGALLAHILIREGINIHVYERYERNSKRDGFQIRLTLPAILGLRSCLTPEYLAAVIENFGPATEVKGEAPRVLHNDFSILVDFSRFPAYGKKKCLSTEVYCGMRYRSRSTRPVNWI